MPTSQEPRQLTEDRDRDMARYIRDHQWRTLEQIAEHDPLWYCWWDKAGRHKKNEDRPADLKVSGLIDGMEILAWFRSHPDWVEIGEWSDERYAAPIRITEAGREALQNRELYDMEPVTGGLVEPGWQATPAPRETAA